MKSYSDFKMLENHEVESTWGKKNNNNNNTHQHLFSLFLFLFQLEKKKEKKKVIPERRTFFLRRLSAITGCMLVCHSETEPAFASSHLESITEGQLCKRHHAGYKLAVFTSCLFCCSGACFGCGVLKKFWVRLQKIPNFPNVKQMPMNLLAGAFHLV